MGHTGRPEEEEKGYEGCSESDGESDVDRPSYPQVQLLWCTCCCFSCHFVCFIISLHYICCQAGKHIRTKNSARKTHGRKIKGSSKLSASADLMLLSEVKCNYCCQLCVCMSVCYAVIVTVSITCRNFLKVPMLLPVLFNCTVLKVGCSVIVNFSVCTYIQFLVRSGLYCTLKSCLTCTYIDYKFVLAVIRIR